MLTLCTYFDRNYLVRGLALYQSLVESGQPFTLTVLCLDEETASVLRRRRHPQIHIVPIADLERADPALAAARDDRTTVEFYWTCTAPLLLHVLRASPQIEHVMYVDADMFFFGDPSTVITSLGSRSVLLVPHDHSPEYADHETAGIYNVGVMAFRNDPIALDALEWWRARCLEWCHYRHEDGKNGDQGYLNDWPERFEGVVVCDHAGIKAAPWNISKYAARRDAGDRITVNGDPLICYHFHGLRLCTRRTAFLMASHVPLSPLVREGIYRPYLEALADGEADVTVREAGIAVPRSGMPWRYIAGRLARFEPVRYFMRVQAR
jgi:hypothetical protein